MSVNQVSVFLENKSGTLNKMTAALTKGGVNIRALSLADTKDFGIVRMIVNDVYEATNILKDADFVAKFTPVLVYTVSDETGGLNELLTYFTEADVNIEYMYAFAGKKQAYMIFRVNDTEHAERLLASKGLRSLSQEDIADV